MRHSTFLEINLSYLSENLNSIKSLAPHSVILPMVKANAYGNGIVPITRFLVGECGIKKIGCATLGEALLLKKECADLKFQTMVFSDTEVQNKDVQEAYIDQSIIPVLHQKNDLEIVLKDSAFSAIPLVLKFNTGMNRLGLTWEEVEPYLPLFKKRGIQHLMTHFSRSPQVIAPNDKTSRQYAEFLKIKKSFVDAGVSIAETSVSNSGAIEQKFGVSETYVRPGLMLYGPPAVSPIIWNGHQISRWVTKVLSTFEAKKGTPIGYGSNVLDKDSFLVVLPIGYGDGFLTYFSGIDLTINGMRGKVFGRVNMDMAFIQFDLSAKEKIKTNDIVEIWNHDNRTITELADQAKTHAYQLMCGVSSRIPRIYKVK